MADVQGLDALVIVGVIVGTLLVLMVMLKSMRWEMTFRQVVMINIFSLLLGILLESWFRDQRETALATVGLAGLLIVWVVVKFRSRSRRGGERQ
jgi:hypothetical protein